MKHLLFAAVLFPSLLFAQLPPPVSVQPPRLPRPVQAATDVLPDNYQVTLVITDKDGQPVEISIVVASPQFTSSIGEQNLNFTGSMVIEESGSVMINYGLGWQTPVTIDGNTQFKASTTQGSVHLKLGEEVQILRAGTRTARLSIKKLEADKAR